jgi:hypothetical protein
MLSHFFQKPKYDASKILTSLVFATKFIAAEAQNSPEKSDDYMMPPSPIFIVPMVIGICICACIAGIHVGHHRNNLNNINPDHQEQLLNQPGMPTGP